MIHFRYCYRGVIVIVYLSDEDRYSVGAVGEVDSGQTYFLAVLIGPCVRAHGDCRVACSGLWCHRQPFGAVECLPGFSGSQVDVVSASAQGVVDGLGMQETIIAAAAMTAAVRIIFFILFSLNFTE